MAGLEGLARVRLRFSGRGERASFPRIGDGGEDIERLSDEKTVGASLLAKAYFLERRCRLAHRIREQARSHKFLR
ncbi:hypothetical protein RY26_06840 [Pseudomonas fluorescens]|nr:hypothetical protein RY26_06840 [Pseudomonas fluorescens]